MTNAQIQNVVAMAHARGCNTFDSYDGAVYLQCQEILQREPDNADAREALENYIAYIATGERPSTGRFAEFALPLPLTDEEIAAEERSRADYIEAYRKAALVGITKGDYAAAKRFQDKHGIRSFLDVSDAELIRLADVPL